MCHLEGPDLGFLLFQFGPCLRELAVEEGRGALRKLLLGSQVFINKKRSKFIVHLLREVRRSGGVFNLESGKFSSMAWGLDELYLDLLTHFFQRISHPRDPPSFPTRRAKTKAADRCLAAG